MKTVIIGSGNVAYHLAKAFVENKIPLNEICGRNRQELEKISNSLHIPFSVTIPEDADVYIICIRDSFIAEVSSKITNSRALVAHTSGSVSRETLQGNYRKAVFYPLQTFSKNKDLNYAEIPFFIDAETTEDEDYLTGLANKISGKVFPADDEKRKYIHLTAVFACNFVNHLYARAKQISDNQNIPFEFFLPLIDETTKKIHHLNPKDAQTGPAIRNDNSVLQLHRTLIKDEEQLKIYDTLNESIKKMYEL